MMVGCGGGDDDLPPPPSAVTSLSVAPGDAVNTVQWSAVDTATSYNLYWSDTSPVTKSSAVIKEVVSPYAHTGLTNGKLLYYRITAVNQGGESDLSVEVSAMPVAPPPPAVTTLSVQPGDGINTIQWPAVQTATSYDLYWSVTSPVTTASAVITGVASPFVHEGLTNGKLVYYAVMARNQWGASALSTEVGAMPVAPVPAAPTTLNATPGDGSVALSWTAASRADSYNLYWSKTSGVVPGAAGVTKIENIRATSYTQVGLTNLETYYYVVTAVSTGGESVASVQASAKPVPPAPGAPANLLATSGDAKVLLSWSGTSDASSYSVYWSKTAGVVPGAVGVTQVPGLTKTSFEHTALTNGDAYYYKVGAVNPGGESLSSEVSARPLPPPPPAPAGVTAVAPKDVVQVTMTWFDVVDYPSASAPIQVGYNLYRGLEPGLATYFKDPSRATKFANVTAPFVDASVVKATTYYYVVTSFVPALPEVESVASGEVAATTSQAGGSGGGDEGGDTGYGNNLSFPLIFADGYGLTGLKIAGTWPGVGPFTTLPTFDYNTGLRPLSTETLTAFPFFDSKSAVSIGGIVYYPQATASTWQAEWRNNATGATLQALVDWGDALLSRTYTTSSIVRIETALKQDATVPGVTDTMSAYKMALLSGQGITENQGTDKSIYASAARNIYAINARLKIEKIATDGGADVLIFNKAIWEGFGAVEEGGGGGGGGSGGAPTASAYSAELNVGGSLVYGYNFRIGQVTGVADKTGQYRITFSLDPEVKLGTEEKVPNHVNMINKLDAAATLAPDGMSTSVIITVN
jgi:fibronectin type 3 domain-containing protein